MLSIAHKQLTPCRIKLALLLAMFPLCLTHAADDEKPAPAPASEKALSATFKMPDGELGKGWEFLLKNDLTHASEVFRTVLEKEASNLQALEGLRACHVTLGEFKEAQQINLRMLEATQESALTEIFAARAQDLLRFTESREAFLKCLSQLIAKREGTSQSILRDYIASQYLHSDRTNEAKKALEGLGYIELWQFAAGPFGSKDKNDPYDRRYSPERPIKNLEFTDEQNKKVKVVTNIPVPQRYLSLSDIFPSSPHGVYYLFTNLECDNEQDVIIGFAGYGSSKVFLRGMPLIQKPDNEEFQRSISHVKTHLIKGNNPILVKTQNTMGITMRVMSTHYAPLKDVRVKALQPEELAKHEASTLRGLTAGQRVNGLVSDFFLQRLAPEDRSSTRWMKALLEKNLLKISEASWVRQAAQRDNDPRANLILGRTLAAFAPDSIGMLDQAADAIQFAGRQMGNSPARETEEAKRLHEHALSVVPQSHQHQLALYFFYQEHKLPDQAFEAIKACAEAHPNSPTALAELSGMLASKGFLVEAEQNIEKAANLDDAYLDRLVAFHKSHGNLIRARELIKKQISLGQLDPDSQLEIAQYEGNLPRVDELLSFLEKAYPDRAEHLLNRRVQLLQDKGDIQAAYDLQKSIFEKIPGNDSQAQREPLVELVDLALKLNKDDEARALLTRYLKETPGDYDLRHRLQALNGSEDNWWETYDIKVSDIDTSQFTAKHYETSNQAWIVDFMATKILPDCSEESYVHIAQKVLNTNGIGELSEVLVRAQRNNIVMVRTLNPDGSSFMPENVHSFDLARTASAYKVGPGSILEHSYLQHQDADRDEPTLNHGFNFNDIDAPRAVSRWTVLISNEALPKLNIRKIRPELIDEKILPGPTGYTVYQWTNKQVEGIKFEPNMPSGHEQECIPMVLIETPDKPYRTSSLLMRQEREHIPPEAIETAQKITAQASDPLDPEAAKFFALENWVRTQIQSGQDSHTLDDVWFSKTGNPGQMTVLLREMAQSVGLKVHAAFLNKSYQPGRIWKSKNVKHQWEPYEQASFDGGFVLVLESAKGPDRWSQFVGQMPKYYDPRLLNSGQGGALALTMSEEGARIKRVNGESLGLTPTSHRIEVALDKNGTGQLTGVLKFFGNAGGRVREGMSDPRRKPLLLDWVVRNWWPKVQSPKVTPTYEDQPERPLIFDYSGVVKGLAAKEADEHFVLPPYLNKAALLGFIGQQDRQNDLLIRNEIADLDHSVSYLAPEGYGWVEVPDDLFIATEFGWFLSDFNVRGRTLTCTRSYLLPQQRVTPENYAKFQTFLKTISADQEQRIGYGPINVESFGGMTEPAFSGGYAGIGDVRQTTTSEKESKAKN